MQSPFAFDPTDGIPDHPVMDIVRSNIRHLMAREGLSELALAGRSGVGQSWIHRYMAGTIKKSNAEKLEKIAAAFGLTAAQLMWTDLTAPGSVGPSQPVGQEAVIIAAAVKIEAMLAEMAVSPPPKDAYAQRLFVAGQVARELGADAILSGEKLVEGVKVLAARLRAAGGG